MRHYLCRSFRTLYCSVWEMNIRALPVETLVGVCSILYPGILMLVVCGFFCESLLSIMNIMSNLVSRRLRKVGSSLMCEDKNNIFKCNKVNSCCFILFFWIHWIQSSHSLYYFLFVWGLLWSFEFLLMNLYFLINFFKDYFFWKTIW